MAKGFAAKEEAAHVSVSGQPTVLMTLTPGTVEQSLQIRALGLSLASQPIETTSSVEKATITAQDLDGVPVHLKKLMSLYLQQLTRAIQMLSVAVVGGVSFRCNVM